jgi:hypothetical protein
VKRGEGKRRDTAKAQVEEVRVTPQAAESFMA